MERKILVDERQLAYGSFFTDDFAKEAFAIADRTPRLQVAIFDLVADWRSASYVGAIPSLLPTILKQFHDSFMNYETPPSGILTYSETILTKLSSEVPELAISPELQAKLRERIVSISDEVLAANSAVKLELNSDEVWQEYLKAHAFVMGLHGTMRAVYLSVYGAYENFITRVLSVAHNGERVRVTDRDFNKLFRSVLNDVIDEAWFADKIQTAKLVRHALMHAGGRVTKELQDRVIPIAVADKQLHVFPEHVAELYKTLKAQAHNVMTAKCFS